MDGWEGMDGWMDGWIDGGKEAETDGRKDGWMDGRSGLLIVTRRFFRKDKLLLHSYNKLAPTIPNLQALYLVQSNWIPKIPFFGTTVSKGKKHCTSYYCCRKPFLSLLVPRAQCGMGSQKTFL